MDLAGVVLDLYDDPEGEVLKTALPQGDFPEFIKSAKKLEESELEALPNDAFALRAIDDGHILRKFATVDKGNTALSVIYFMHNKDKLPEEAQKTAAANLVEACLYHDLKPPQGIMDLSESVESDDSLIDITGQSAPLAVENPEQTFVADSPEKVAAACDYFDENFGNMHPRERHGLATTLVKAAARYGVEVSEGLDRYGATTYAPNLDLGREIRVHHLDQDDKEGHRLLSDLFKTASVVKPSKFAEALADFDEGMGLSIYWDRGVPDPWSSTFGTVKIAAEYVYVDGNDRVSGSALEKLSQNPILMSESFSKEIVTAFQKDPTGIFESMPTPHKKIIMRIASDNYTGGVNARTAG